jgi:hypothetical protein
VLAPYRRSVEHPAQEILKLMLGYRIHGHPSRLYDAVAVAWFSGPHSLPEMYPHLIDSAGVEIEPILRLRRS